MNQDQFLLYGANGYTGELIARMAGSYQLKPILAGRSAVSIEPLARELNLPFLVFSLEETDKLAAALKEVPLVLHAAGPFIHTAKPMVEACIQAGKHYLDINGDISCFELVKKYGPQAADKGVMLMPGVGFDVVPTDCLALSLKNRLPDAVTLKIAFASRGSTISHGTAMTMAGKIGEGGAVRHKGKIRRRPLGEHGMMVNFGPRQLFVMSIPWGDVSTAYHTTGIPDIETFTAVPRRYYKWLKFQRLYNWMLRTDSVRGYIRKKIKNRPAGPDEKMRANAKSLVWAEAENIARQKVYASIEGPEGYQLTALSSLIITKKVLEGKYRVGYQTPAGCYGERLVFEIPGVKKLLPG
jgi:short subunit dehydrogenase-like uncharacterized protein